MDLTRSIGTISDKNKKKLYILLSFVIPFVVIVLALIALHVAPFGDHSLAISDGKGYVYGLVGHSRFLKSLISGNGEILNSLNGLGINFWASSAWGNFTPVKLLTLFITMETAPDCLTWISTVSLSICGLTMYALLAHVRGHKFSNLIFSTSYALIGFSVVNCYQILFFVGPQLLPLMVLGLIKLMKGKSPLTYILSLGFCIFFNFYFGLHLCIASLVFFLAYVYVNNKSLIGVKKQRFGVWLGSSFLAGLLPAFFWLPALKAFSGGGRLNQTGITEFAFKENMPFIQIFTKLFSGANSTNEMVNGLPNIFCGIMVVALVVLFFVNRKIDIRKKKAAGIVIGFYLLTFYITAFTLAMHGGTHTNWFPFRYSYVFSFILIYIAAEVFSHLDEITLQDTKKVGIVMLIATAIVFSTSYEYISGGSVVLDFALLLAMWFGFYMYKTKPEKAPQRILSLFLIIFVCGNLYANYVLSIYKVREWELDMTEYSENVFKNGALIDAVQEADTDFYRLEKETQDLGSLAADAELYGYYGVSTSGPAIRAFINKESCKIGLNWFDMRHWYSEGIPAATDVLLGLRYILSERDLTEEKGYENKINVNGMTLYQNQNALPISILSNAQVSELMLGEDLFANLNEIWKAMTGGSEDVFTEQKGTVNFTLKNTTSDQSITSEEIQESISMTEAGEESEYTNNSIIEYTFTAEKDGPIYVFDTSIPESPSGLDVPAVRYVGSYHKGDTVINHFTIYNGQGTGDILRGYCANQVFAYADEDVLEKYAKQINSRDIIFNKDTDSHLYGTFTAETDQRILFTIAWDEGWTCYIDGQQMPIDKTWNLFMSVEVPEGKHTWEMRFFPAWMNYGIYISIGALVGLVIFMILWKRKNKAVVAAQIEHHTSDMEHTEGIVVGKGRSSQGTDKLRIENIPSTLLRESGKEIPGDKMQEESAEDDSQADEKEFES